MSLLDLIDDGAWPVDPEDDGEDYHIELRHLEPWQIQRLVGTPHDLLDPDDDRTIEQRYFDACDDGYFDNIEASNDGGPIEYDDDPEADARLVEALADKIREGEEFRY